MIVAEWRKEPGNVIHEGCHYVRYSDHPRFTQGTRFDLGFLSIALAEGFDVLLLGQGGDDAKTKP